jgi:hypothetical protein
MAVSCGCKPPPPHALYIVNNLVQLYMHFTSILLRLLFLLRLLRLLRLANVVVRLSPCSPGALGACP